MAIRLDLEICPVSKIRGKSGARRGIWILDGPSRFLETVQLSKIRGEARNLASGWPEPRSWKLVYSRNPGSPPPPALSLTVQCVRLPPVFLNRYRSFIFLCSWKLGILESGNCDHFTGSMHVSRTRNALATLQGHRARRAQRLGQSARPARAAGGSASRRSTLASSPHRLMRGALKVALLFAATVTFSAVMAVSTDMLAPLPHDWICAAPAKSAGTGAPSAVAGAVGALTGC